MMRTQTSRTRPLPSTWADRISAAECEPLAMDTLLELTGLLSRRVQEETARAVEREQQLLRQANHAAMGEMFANITHQWKQPLCTLGLIIQNIRYDNREGCLDQDTLQKHLDTAQLAIDQMATTIDDFRLFFARTDAENKFGLLAAIRKCVDLTSASLCTHHIELVVSGEEVLVCGRQGEFLHVILNLIANAKDALLEQRASGRKITIEVMRSDSQAMVCFRDNAGGINEDMFEKIFAPYFTTKEYGTGIGLYMTRTIIEQHMAGQIWAENWTEGAQFHIVIPLTGRASPSHAAPQWKTEPNRNPRPTSML